MTAQDEQRIKQWLGELKLLVEGVQEQISELKQQIDTLKVATPSGPLSVTATKKTKATVEEPTETK